ncbi:protein kinase domain-containing protein [Rubritalea tangerina]|uniref:Protein kinase n=1 Tax=Rubritalea tangerina TaxID=430798 RepID=A0ABW4ZFU3_9BACT
MPDQPIELLADTRYSDESFIAEGAIKAVYSVYDNYCSRFIALARIKNTNSTLEQAVDFIREVQITSSLEHPNIIRIYDLGITDSTPWFTMELTSGKTIADKINLELTLTERLLIFSQICSAVAYAHSMDILHLDLKPNNITIGQQDQILVCDWGLASSISTQIDADLFRNNKTRGYIKGTPGFMAPEQAHGHGSLDKRTDTFGLGALFFYLLTGRSPIPGKNDSEVLTNTRTPSPLPLECPEIPSRLLPVVEKALAPNPDQRYQTADAFLSEIQKYLEGFATHAEEANKLTRAKLFYQRNRLLCNLTTLFLLSLIGSSVFYISALKKSERSALLSRDLAQDAEQRAELSRRATQQALDAALNAQQLASDAEKAKDQATLTLANVRVNINRLHLDMLKNKQALADAKRAVKEHPNNPAALLQLGFSYFVVQNFTEAAANFNRANKLSGDTPDDTNSIHDLTSLAEEYSSHSYPLKAQDLVELLAKLDPKRIYLRRYMLHYDGTVSSPEDHAVVVHAMLEFFNKKTLKFHYDAVNQILDLSGNGDVALHMLTKNKKQLDAPLFQLLPVKQLVIDNTPNNQQFILKIPRSLVPKINLQ